MPISISSGSSEKTEDSENAGKAHTTAYSREDPAPDTLGGRLLSRLRERELSTRQFAKICGFSQPTVFKWIHNEREPDFKNCRIMAKALGVSPHWLAFGDETNVRKSKPLVTFFEGEALELTDSFCRANFHAPADVLRVVKVTGESLRPRFRAGDSAVIQPYAQPSKQHGLYWLKDEKGERLVNLPSTLEGTPAQSAVIGRVVGRILIHEVSI